MLTRLFLAVLLLATFCLTPGCGGGSTPQPAVVPPPADPLPNPTSGEVHRMQKKLDLAP